MKNGEKIFTEMVLKRRNLSIFLLELSETCITLEDDESRNGLFLSYIFFKKSTATIVNLYKFLKNEKDFENELDTNFFIPQRKNF